ncbi:MAG TPA: hypothetical protein VEU97_03940 [Ktedonobacteraceae bacterium]|nr:hypothetical protein [Ktedonobacteraceae bacterium]
MSTRENEIRNVAVAIQPAGEVITDADQPGRRRWYTIFFSPIWACLLVAVLFRAWLVFHTHGVIDGDEGLVGIQAERILHGDFPIYFYGIPYFGSLQAYLIALVFAVTGPSVWALRAEPLLVSLLLVWLTWSFAGALAEIAQLPVYARRNFTTIAALIAAVPPLYDGVLELRTYGGHIETFALIMLLLLATLRLTQRWHAGAPARELSLRWAGIGFIVGLGFWVYPLIAIAVLAAAIWIIGSLVVEVFKQSRRLPVGAKRSLSTILSPAQGLLYSVAAIPTAIVGFTPALIWGANNKWANIFYILNLGGGRGGLHQRLNIIQRVSGAYVTCIAPRIISGTLPTARGILTTLHWPLLMVSTFFIFASLALIATSFFWQTPSLVSIRQVMALPTIFAACCVYAFCTSSASVYTLLGCNLDDTGRYATPLSLAFPFFFAAIFAFVSMVVHERGKPQLTSKAGDISAPRRASRSPGRWGVLVQGLLFALLLVYVGLQAWSYVLTDPGLTFQSNYCTVNPANNDPIIAYMQQQHIHYFWASNLLAYPIVFKTDRNIIGADPRALLHHDTINRIPAYTDAILHADRPSMLVVIHHNDPHPRLLKLLDERNITYHMAVFPSEPGYDVLVVTPVSRTVSPLEKGFDIFQCLP